MFKKIPCWLGASICLLCSLSASANPFLGEVERATPARRVILVLNYFDTCRAVAQNQTYAIDLLNDITQVGEKTHDEQLRRYCWYLKNTWPKFRIGSHAGNAALFLAVGAQARQEDNRQIAAVCRHFAGQYFFLNGEYGKAFEHLLAANKAFGEIGYSNIPEISRYLYELAFNYYYFQDYDKVIRLLTEASRFPIFSENLAIQTHNTVAMAYTARFQLTRNADDAARAERQYLHARQTAAFYGDSLWIGIATGHLADLYIQQQQWQSALAALRIDYAIGLRFGSTRALPNQTALTIAAIYMRRRQLDSCLYFLQQSMVLYKRNLANPAFGRDLRDEYYLKGYYEVARKYYQAVNDPPKAYLFSDSLNLLVDRINKRYNIRQMALAEQKLLIEKHQLEVETFGNEQRAQRLMFWAGGLVLTLVALLFFNMYRLSRFKRRQEGKINAQKEKSLQLEKRLVEEELQRAKAELTAFVDNFQQKNVLLDTITAQPESLSRMQPIHSQAEQLVETRQKLVDSSLLTNESWDEFRRRFERVHPGFFAQLKAQFTDLSPAEERLLALSKLGIDTRQMSRMLGIAPDSIRKTKYRLRKKLGLHGTSPLVTLPAEPMGYPAND